MRPIDPARSRAVVVGAPVYDDAALTDVPEVTANAVDFAGVLTDQRLGGFDPAHCAVAPWRASVAEVGDLLMEAAAEAEDLLLFYYSGHGILSSVRRELYLGVAGTRPDRLPFTGVPFDAIRDACLSSRATTRVVILDCCFSGRAIGDTLAGAGEAVMGQVQVTGTFTLTSAPANATALVLPGETHTAFTGRMLRLLRGGIPNGSSMLTLGDIYKHLYAQAVADGLPRPQQRGTETADLVGLVRNHQVIGSAMSGFGKNVSPDWVNEDLNDVEVIILLQGNNATGDPVFSYLKLLGSSLREMFRAMAAGQNFSPAHYGEVLEAGLGDPPAEIRQKMKEKYNMIDVPAPRRSD
jgi:Caspase domain